MRDDQILPVYWTLDANPELQDYFARKEEYGASDLDKHGRFQFAHSRYRNPFVPVVSRYLVSRGMHIKYPGNHPFAVCLTHDVDEIFVPMKHKVAALAYSAKSLNLRQIQEQAALAMRKKQESPYRNFRQIIDIEKKYGATSTFFFMATDRDPVRFRYKIEDLKEDFRYIVESGWDIGLHTGYYSWDNLEDIKSEKKRLENVLGKSVDGCRNHYLRFRTPDTWELLAKAGFKYDTTFGYSETMGFRNGMCHPFNPVNLNTGKQIDILEFPLNIMDATFIGGFGLNADLNHIEEQIQGLIDVVEQNHGVLTVLWHNATFGCPFLEGLASIYEFVLNSCSLKGAWITSADKMYLHLARR